MKTSYDFSFLTSPRNVRRDNWIGQHFVLSYLNSEEGINFPFRYRPFEIAKAQAEQYRLAAHHPVREGHFLSSDMVDKNPVYRSTMQMRPDIKLGWREVLSAVSNRTFSRAVTESIGMIMTLVSSIRDTGDDYVNPILSTYLQAHRIEEIQEALHHLCKNAPKSKSLDSVLHLWSNFEKVIPRPDAIIGRMMIGKLKQWLLGSFSLKDLAFGIRHYSTDTHTIEKYIDSYKMQIPFYDPDQSYIGYGIRDQYDGTVAQQKNAERPSQFSTHTVSPLFSSREESIGFYQQYHLLERQIPDGFFEYQEIFDRPISEGTDLSLSFADKNKLYGHDITDRQFAQSKEQEVRFYTIENFIKFREKEICLLSMTSVDKFDSKEVRLISEDLQYIEIMGKDTRNIEAIQKRFEMMGHDSATMEVLTRIELSGVSSTIDFFDSYVYKNEKESTAEEGKASLLEVVPFESKLYDLSYYIDKARKNSIVYIQPMQMDPIRRPSVAVVGYEEKMNVISEVGWMDWAQPHLDKVSKLFEEENKSVMLDLVELEFRYDLQDVSRLELLPFESRIDVIDEKLHLLPMDSMTLQDMYRRLSKLERSSWIQFALLTLSQMEKAALIESNLEFFNLLETDAYLYQEELTARKHNRLSQVETMEFSEKENRDITLTELLVADAGKLDSYIVRLMGADRPDEFEAMFKQIVFAPEPENIGIKLDHKLAPEPENIGIIQRFIDSNREMRTQEATIPQTPYRLSGDNSDWDDIWNRYTAGVDILDPPDSDFDYSKLTSRVYDLKTGVPHTALGPTNQADVLVPIPLHHPLPEHFGVGEDVTRELPVDNYVLIDVILAIESLKNRSRLRYAGMPAERAMRELFSKLYTWIQQSSPNDPEYDRMFRFSRWYSESIVLKLSKHILHRVYNAWRSKFHMGENLGIPYSSVNWDYFPSAIIAQTTDIHAEYLFEKTNHIDGQFIIRGYFDNPVMQGTMKVMIDDSLVDTVQTNGAFTRIYDVPQGNHDYQLIFDGESGRVSLSTLEISGCEFISATTTSDDSDTNGLKAMTELVNQLLAYYDKHHADGKVKGTMQVKQRRVWQQT